MRRPIAIYAETVIGVTQTLGRDGLPCVGMRYHPNSLEIGLVRAADVDDDDG